VFHWIFLGGWMRHRELMPFFGLGLALFSGCASAPPLPWPNSNLHYQPYQFEAVASTDEAQANIRDLQANLGTGPRRPGSPVCTDMEVDPESAHMTFEWTGHEAVNSHSVTEMEGSNGSLHTAVSTRVYEMPTQKKKIVVLPFRGIDSVALLDRGEAAVFYLDTGMRVQLVGDNAGVASKLANSVMTLAKANGNQTLPDYGFEIAMNGLTDRHKAALNLDHGIVVGPVESGGLAEKAGVEPGDVLLDVNGQAVNSREDFIAQLKSGKPMALHLRNYTRTQGSEEIRFTSEKNLTLTVESR
jgi:hypothetical protein